MWQLHQNKTTLLSVILIIILCIPAVFGLVHSGFFISDDGTWMIVRFSAFYDALRHGEFPVRFLPRINFGYGYPVADFLYPLFMYIGVPIKLLGFHFVTTIKIMLGLSIIFSEIFCFFWLRTKCNDLSSIAGTIVYTLFPYHLWDMYKRGSVGEVLALAIVPFIFWQLERKNIALGGLGVGLLILAHNVLALLFLPVFLLYVVLKKYPVKDICILFLIGLGISAFFWIPALIDKQYTVFDRIAVSDFQKYFLGTNDLYLFGFISVIVLIHSLYLLISRRVYKFDNGWFFWIISAVSISLTLSISQIFWKYAPGTSFIQFPFRLLSLTVLGVSFLTAMSIHSAGKKYAWIVTIIYISLVYISSWKLFLPKTFQDFPDTFYTTNVNSTTVQNEYMPIWVKQPPTTIPPEKVKIIKGQGNISDIQVKGNNLQFKANITSSGTVQVNTVYFPGWKVFIDKKQAPFYYDNPYGVVQFLISSGTHTVQLKFTETTERLISDVISIIAVIFAAGIILKERKNNFQF